jgi:hypothetical protein
MFDPKTLLQGAASRAPGFILAKPTGIIDGIIGATLTMAFWCCRSGWISTFFSVVVCVAVAYGVGRMLDLVIPYAIRLVDSSYIIAAAPMPVAAPPTISGGSDSTPPKAPAQIAGGSKPSRLQGARGKQGARTEGGEKLD